jgi:hypothetical protein
VKRLPVLCLAVAAALVVSAAPPPATAAAAGAGAAGVEVIATGLDNPRGVIVADGGLVLVTEAGRGGPGPCITGALNLQFCLGATGAVTAVTAGHQRRVVTGLPSLLAPATGETEGPADIALTGSGALVSIGFGTEPARRPQLGPGGRLTGRIVRLDRREPRSFADLAAYEAAYNPDHPETGPDSDPYGLAPGPAGGALAVDAGGNDVLRVDRNGRISTLAVLRARPATAPNGSVVPMQSVPTTVVRGVDGAYYIGELTGFPFPVGGANIWRLVPGQAPTVAGTGFTNIIDIAFDRQGRLLVLEIYKNGLLSGDPTGALIRVNSDGTRTELASTGLYTPTSVAVGADDSLYVSNKGTLVGAGEVLRIRPPT